jgi:hypothetical protein
MDTPPAQLEHAALGLRDVVFQGISHIGPALSVVFILPLIAGRAGAAMPISLALAVVVWRLLHLCLARPRAPLRIPDDLELPDL